MMRLAADFIGVTTVEIFAFSLELNLGGDWTALKFFGVLLGVLFFVFTVLAGLQSASQRLINTVWPATLGVLALIGIVLFSDFRKSGDDTVRISAETERLSVESGQSDSRSQAQTEADPEQNGSELDSFSHTKAYKHQHDGLGQHWHDGEDDHEHD